jgi:hypothetical protein
MAIARRARGANSKIRLGIGLGEEAIERSLAIVCRGGEAQHSYTGWEEQSRNRCPRFEKTLHTTISRHALATVYRALEPGTGIDDVGMYHHFGLVLFPLDLSRQ